jgi:hypothetical protein
MLIFILNTNFYFNIFVIVLDPRLKLQYMQDHQWESRWINQAKKDVLYFLILFLFFKFLNFI